MWVTLILMVVAFLMTKSSTGSSKKALAAAAGAGLGAGYVTSQTEWGSSLNTDFNNFFGMDDSWTGFSGDASGTDAAGSGTGGTSAGATGGSAGTKAPTGSSGGLFSGLPTWLGGAAAVGAGAAATSWSLKNVPQWVWWGAGAIGVFWLLKD